MTTPLKDAVASLDALLNEAREYSKTMGDEGAFDALYAYELTALQALQDYDSTLENKGQSRKSSLVEAVCNVAIGYTIAIAAQMVIFPWFGIHIGITEHVLIGVLFTFVSLARSYLLRRMFNLLQIRKTQ